MAASYSFRKALNGFHREDVVHHLEYINTKHTTQVNQLKAELDTKDKEIQRLRAFEGLQAQVDRLQQEKMVYEDRITQLQLQLEEQIANQTAIVSRTEEELEAYRRAERLERQAQERAEQLCQKANTIVSTAGSSVDSAAHHIGQLSQQVAAQLALLQQEILSSKSVLEEAAGALNALCPETTEV